MLCMLNMKKKKSISCKYNPIDLKLMLLFLFIDFFTKITFVAVKGEPSK